MVSGQEIACASIAGVESHGMCCSEKELGISDNHAGLMELPEDTIVGTDICDLYAIKDTVFEVDNKSLTNRPDLWGHYGIAREFAALSGRELKPLETVSLEAYDNLEPIQIDVQDDLCYRYTGLKVRNIQKKVSPCGYAHPPVLLRHARDQPAGRFDQLPDAGDGPAHARLRLRQGGPD